MIVKGEESVGLSYSPDSLDWQNVTLLINLVKNFLLFRTLSTMDE